MVDSRNLQLLIAFLLIIRVTSDTCYSPDGGYYYCAAGQTCGSYYNDCQGLPTYAIIGIVALSIMFLSICIRCCIYANGNNNSRPLRRRIVRARPITRAGQVYITPDGTAYAARPVSVPIHTIIEDAPPSYDIATSGVPPKF